MGDMMTLDYDQLYPRDELLKLVFGPDSAPPRWRFNRWVREGLEVVRDGQAVWLTPRMLERFLKTRPRRTPSPRSNLPDGPQLLRGSEAVRSFYEEQNGSLDKKHAPKKKKVG